MNCIRKKMTNPTRLMHWCPLIAIDIRVEDLPTHWESKYVSTPPEDLCSSLSLACRRKDSSRELRDKDREKERKKDRKGEIEGKREGYVKRGGKKAGVSSEIVLSRLCAHVLYCLVSWAHLSDSGARQSTKEPLSFLSPSLCPTITPIPCPL